MNKELMIKNYELKLNSIINKLDRLKNSNVSIEFEYLEGMDLFRVDNITKNNMSITFIFENNNLNIDEFNNRLIFLISISNVD